MEITVADDVRKLVENAPEDYRICTACTGPALVPISVKQPKTTDIVIPLGNGRKIYVSRVQARYMTEITMDMLYDEEDIDSCPAFYEYNIRKSEQRMQDSDQ
ncbi:MAG: hypothetical protein ACOX8X_01005 [Methanomethylophilus sp.]|jgi:hypothetical protein